MTRQQVCRVQGVCQACTYKLQSVIATGQESVSRHRVVRGGHGDTGHRGVSASMAVEPSCAVTSVASQKGLPTFASLLHAPWECNPR